MKTFVIYHNADFDGLFCREIAKIRSDDSAVYIGLNYGDAAPAIPDDTMLYMLDISVPELMNHPNLVWIDHHKTAITKFNPAIKGYRIDGVAACRLAYQWFLAEVNGTLFRDLPTLAKFVDRKVSEPIAVQLAGEYDIWDKRDPRTDILQHGLRSQPLTDENWVSLLTEYDGSGTPFLNQLIKQGAYVSYSESVENAELITGNGFTVDWEGYKFLACNTSRGGSLVFNAGVRYEHDGLLSFRFEGKRWKVSLYGVLHKKHLDFSPIAAKYGGGGHAQACGFTLDNLPFLPK